jgi:hypothetical protein
MYFCKMIASKEPADGYKKKLQPLNIASFLSILQ